MKRQKIAAGCLAAVMLLGLSFWAGTRTQPWEIPALPSTDDVLQMEETAFADANVLKFACPFSRGSFQSQVLQKFCDFLNQKFAPEIYIQFYDGGELGPEMGYDGCVAEPETGDVCCIYGQSCLYR